jgi:hypothetical protein
MRQVSVLAAPACATVVKGALGPAGIGMDDSPVPTTKREPLRIRPASPIVQSGYREWSPVSGQRVLDRGQLLQTPWDTCEPVRRAADGLEPARRLVLPTERVATMGPLEVRAALLPTILAGGLGANGFDRPDGTMSVPSAPSTGTLPCGFPIFNIGLTWYSSNESLVAW